MKTNLKLKSSDNGLSLELSGLAKWAVTSEKPYRVGLAIIIKHSKVTALKIQPQNISVTLLQSALPVYDQYIVSEESSTGKHIVYCDFVCKECVVDPRGVILSPREHGVPVKIILSDFLIMDGTPVVFDTVDALLPTVGKEPN